MKSKVRMKKQYNRMPPPKKKKKKTKKGGRGPNWVVSL
jgi:hypothetical protein